MSRRKGRWKESGIEEENGGNTRTYRTPFVVRHVASCRRCKRWDERGVRGIVGVGKLKAEAPRCRSGQPTPRCFAQKKKRERRNRKKGGKRAESEIASQSENLRTLGGNACFSRGREIAFRDFNPSTKRRGIRTTYKRRVIHTHYQLIRLRVPGMSN